MSKEFENKSIEAEMDEQDLKEAKTLIKQEDMERLNREAESYAGQFDTAEDGSVSEVLKELGDLGEKEQRVAGETMDSLKRPVNDLMNKSNNDIPRTLNELKNVVSDLDPKQTEGNAVTRFFYKMSNKKPIERYMKKYETVDGRIETIVRSLLAGKDRLEEDSVELGLIKESARERIYELEKQIYLGKKLFQLLKEKEGTGEHDDALIEEGKEKIITRTRNMTQMKSVLIQSISSVDIIKRNNEKLKESIRNAVTLTKNIITVSATIQLALNNQKEVIDTVNGVNKATEEMLLSNSRNLRDNTKEATSMMENPAISIEALQESFDNVFEALETTEQSSERIIASSEQFIEEMDQLNANVRKKLAGSGEAGQRTLRD
ncbi:MULTISPECIES: toxic anion resistance protein [Salimicrobium]|uniref:Toxic anion resistance protein n=1 Tax=Salimicrobium humidisoli TaxID=2029857 RepID=A0ABX4HU73_9BACI|nr:MULTISPECIES: toxic anion resistance protein [Salimicrobium]PBB06633.1 toxic anion resistance protein [Salimicrobium humidisoli]